MPKGYPERFAARLRAELGRDVAEARAGEALREGAVRFAPGDRHLRVVRRGGGFGCELVDGPPVTGHCPSVDVLFESVARAAGATGLGVILTGMGRDGATGLAAMRRAGAVCLAQGPESSVVWGMPRAAREIGAVDEEAELAALPRRICHHLTALGRTA
jgi:two-component system chemotaxis response regulator CheB